MNSFSKLVLTNLVLLALGGLATESHASPAKEHNKKHLSATVNKSYDTTWEAMFRHASASFFVLEDFDKSSGLIILSFGASNAHQYIDCGRMNKNSAELKYKGPYTSFLEQYAGAKLRGKMSIVITELLPKKTGIRINGKYEFASKLTEPALLTFDSGYSATISVSKEQAETGIIETKTCHSTNKAENNLMQAINLLK